MESKFSFSSDFADTSLQLGSPIVVTPYLNTSGGNKMNQGVASSVTGTSMAPIFGNIGSSSSSKLANKRTVCNLTSSGRDVQEDLPLNFNPDFDLDLGPNRMRKDVNRSSFIPVAPEKKKLDIDLELSLSTCASESDITSITLASSPVQNSVEILAASGVSHHVDEGSTSSKWRRGPLIPPLQGEQTACVNLESNANNTMPILFSPAMTSSAVPQSDDAVRAANSHPNQPRKTCVKTCLFPGCEKGARGASGRCISHGGGRRCQKPGCHRGAEGKTAFCKAHGGGRRCEHLGCTKSAEGRTSNCIAHGGGRRCSYPEGCTRAARGKSGLCIRHGGGKRCTFENCTKSAEGLSGLCIAHGGGRRCQFPECTKGAQGSTKFCKAHGGGKRCTYPCCSKGAEGSTLFCKGHGGGKRCSFQGGGACTKSVHGGTLFCVAHGGGKRCAVPECTKSARGRTSYCVRHGGGKRCKYEDCGKSAQGCTDFCKAHGGGKRCSWGQPGSGYGVDGAFPCDKFARGKIGLCAAHTAQVQDMRAHGNGTVGLMLREPKPKKAKEETAVGNTCGFGFTGFQFQPSPTSTIPNGQVMSAPTTPPAQGSLPEGRVHRGGLMAMLLGHVGAGRPTGAGKLVG